MKIDCSLLEIEKKDLFLFVILRKWENDRKNRWNIGKEMAYDMGIIMTTNWKLSLKTELPQQTNWTIHSFS